MESKILTISIAAYNVEKYLSRCLDSLASKEIIDDIEVFIVDDGGSDGSLDIAKDYESKYPDTFHAIHKVNGGYGSTVNYSIDNASGKYFKLLDGDDYYDTEGLVRLVRYLKTTDVDVVANRFLVSYKDRVGEGLSFENNPIDTEFDIKDLVINNGMHMHALTYKTSLLRDTNTRLPEHVLYSDNIYSLVPFIKAKTVVFKDYVVYHYFQNHPGQSIDKNTFIKHIPMLEKISDEVLDIYKSIDIDNPNIGYLTTRAATTLVDHLRVLLFKNTNKETFEDLIYWDNKINGVSKRLYDRLATLDRKSSKAIKILRSTNYMAYFPLSFIYGVRKF